jgi:hypothetical protein
MNTHNIYTRTLMIFLLFALLFSACGEAKPALTDIARINDDGSVELVGGGTLDRIAPEAIAINAVLTIQRGAFALINEGQHIAVFIAPGGQTANGTNFYFSAFINTSRVALVDARRQLQMLGIDSAKIQTLQQMVNALKEQGFEELTCATTPTLIATLRLGMGFLRSIGSTISDVLVVPAVMLTPEMMYPWMDCTGGMCEGRQQ